jgi:hypothetical protein
MLLNLLVGILSAGLTIVLILSLKFEQEKQIYAFALIIAALIYIAFSFNSEEWQWIVIESLGALIFSTMAVLGLKLSPLWLVAGWATHPIWDVSLHQIHSTSFVPSWYPIVCLGYDCVIAIYLLLRLKKESNLSDSIEEA